MAEGDTHGEKLVEIDWDSLVDGDGDELLQFLEGEGTIEMHAAQPAGPSTSNGAEANPISDEGGQQGYAPVDEEHDNCFSPDLTGLLSDDDDGNILGGIACSLNGVMPPSTGFQNLAGCCGGTKQDMAHGGLPDGKARDYDSGSVPAHDGEVLTPDLSAVADMAATVPQPELSATHEHREEASANHGNCVVEAAGCFTLRVEPSTTTTCDAPSRGSVATSAMMAVAAYPHASGQHVEPPEPISKQQQHSTLQRQPSISSTGSRASNCAPAVGSPSSHQSCPVHHPAAAPSGAPAPSTKPVQPTYGVPQALLRRTTPPLPPSRLVQAAAAPPGSRVAPTTAGAYSTVLPSDSGSAFACFDDPLEEEAYQQRQKARRLTRAAAAIAAATALGLPPPNLATMGLLPDGLLRRTQSAMDVLPAQPMLTGSHGSVPQSFMPSSNVLNKGGPVTSSKVGLHGGAHGAAPCDKDPLTHRHSCQDVNAAPAAPIPTQRTLPSCPALPPGNLRLVVRRQDPGGHNSGSQSAYHTPATAPPPLTSATSAPADNRHARVHSINLPVPSALLDQPTPDSELPDSLLEGLLDWECTPRAVPAPALEEEQQHQLATQPGSPTGPDWLSAGPMVVEPTPPSAEAERSDRALVSPLQVATAGQLLETVTKQDDFTDALMDELQRELFSDDDGDQPTSCSPQDCASHPGAAPQAPHNRVVEQQHQQQLYVGMPGCGAMEPGKLPTAGSGTGIPPASASQQHAAPLPGGMHVQPQSMCTAACHIPGLAAPPGHLHTSGSGHALNGAMPSGCSTLCMQQQPMYVQGQASTGPAPSAHMASNGRPVWTPQQPLGYAAHGAPSALPTVFGRQQPGHYGPWPHPGQCHSSAACPTALPAHAAPGQVVQNTISHHGSMPSDLHLPLQPTGHMPPATMAVHLPPVGASAPALLPSHGSGGPTFSSNYYLQQQQQHVIGVVPDVQQHMPALLYDAAPAGAPCAQPPASTAAYEEQQQWSYVHEGGADFLHAAEGGDAYCHATVHGSTMQAQQQYHT